MSNFRRLPPIWLMGLTNATFGMMGGFAVVTVPEMLAAQGIGGGRIAEITAAILSPGFWVFLLAPMLDVRFSRRTYALVFSVLAAVGVAVTITHRTEVRVVEWSMLLGYVAASLVQGAVGGWMGSLIGPEDDSQLGTWFAIGNMAAGGLMMVVAGELIAHLRQAVAGVVAGGMLMLPTLIYLALPAPGPDRRLAGESFRRLFGEIRALVQRREVLVALMLFVLPASSFALTNVLGGLGRDFSASERMVSLLAGVGGVFAGVCGSLLLPPLAGSFRLRPLYLGIGIVGAMFTLGLLLLPHTPATFAIAMTGENMFQALAFAAGNAITFETIGQGNPLAATQFSLLIAAANAPIVLMGFVDGRAYTWRGLRGSLVVDAGVSLGICMLLGLGLRALDKRPRVSS